MRLALLYNPRLLCERIAVASVRRRRLAELRGMPGATLKTGHIDALELLKLARATGIGTIYDVGAHTGTFTLLAKSVIPDAQVHAFEPIPEHQVAFRDSVAELADVTLHGLALGPEDGEGTLHVTDFPDASSLLPPRDTVLGPLGVREVSQMRTRIVRLDDYRASANLPYPDLIKLDVQGYELEVLRGGTECLRTAKAVIAEVSFIPYYEGQCLFHDLVAYLADYGLFARAFGVNTPTGQALGQTDVLFVKGT